MNIYLYYNSEHLVLLPLNLVYTIKINYIKMQISLIYDLAILNDNYLYSFIDIGHPNTRAKVSVK